jgi:intracellular sulfur oxidation DsrE/DsrF family protein
MSNLTFNPQPSQQRRSFLTRLNAGAALAALALGRPALARAKPARWEPTRHAQDNWMNQLPGKHRIVFDTTSDARFGDALLYASNFLVANKSGYSLQNTDLAVIIIARHLSTGFGFNNAMWAKYGAQMAKLSEMKTQPASNPRLSGETGIETLTRQGVHFAVCAMATSFFAGLMAKEMGLSAEAITAELSSNLVPNAHMVPAGIVAVNRAQELGYTLVTP